MASNMSTEEQVAALTPEQRNKIPRIGKTAIVAQMVVAIPALLLAIVGLMNMINNPLDITETYYLGFMTMIALAFVWILGVLLFVKIKYPYYSDAKAKYIMNQQKKEKNA